MEGDRFKPAYPNAVYDGNNIVSVVDVLNEFHRRLLALEGRAEMEDSYEREQRERQP